MQPVFRSSTTSLITPISSPCDDFTFVPTILLAWTYVVLLVVVLWVCANVEATAKPKKAIVAVSMIDVFMSDKSFGALCASRQTRIVARRCHGCENNRCNG